MSEWQPIETAPDGLHILFFPKQEGRNELSEMMKIDFYPVSYPRKPTHWMPLPPHPTKGDQE